MDQANYAKAIDNEQDRFKPTIEAANKILEIENVALIIYVDDKFDVNGQEVVFLARLKQMRDKNKPIKTQSFSGLSWDGPAAKFEKEISQLWEKTKDKRSILQELHKGISDQEMVNILPALEIEECFGDKIKLMTPDEWIDDNMDIFKPIGKDQKVVCLFDFEFQSGNSKCEGRNGAQLAQVLISKEELSQSVICGIFSHKFPIEDENDFRDLYAKDYSIDKSRFYTISKYRFSSEPRIAGFTEGIKNLLLHPYVENLKNEALEVLKESSKKAFEEISSISPETFNQIIQKSSLKEGVWEVSTLFRLYGILSKRENYKIISDAERRRKFNNSIEHIRQIDKIDTKFNFISKNKQLVAIRESELYLVSDILNQLHLPVSNGDLFEIGGKEYILLVQPCNLALRANGSSHGKRSHNYDMAILVPLRTIERDRIGLSMEVVQESEQSQKSLVAEFSKFKIMSLVYLDLVVFDKSGNALIDLNNQEYVSDVIHFPWKMRYQYIHEHFKKLEQKTREFETIDKLVKHSIDAITQELNAAKKEKNIKKVKQLGIEISSLRRHLQNSKKAVSEISDLSQFKIDCSSIYDPETRVFNLEIKRTRHYKSQYSDDLLQKFMQYMSRNAFDHDFSKV